MDAEVNRVDETGRLLGNRDAVDRWVGGTDAHGNRVSYDGERGFHQVTPIQGRLAGIDGVGQSLKRVVGLPPPVHEVKNLPYQSESSLPQAA